MVNRPRRAGLSRGHVWNGAQASLPSLEWGLRGRQPSPQASPAAREPRRDQEWPEVSEQRPQEDRDPEVRCQPDSRGHSRLLFFPSRLKSSSRSTAPGVLLCWLNDWVTHSRALPR